MSAPWKRPFPWRPTRSRWLPQTKWILGLLLQCLLALLRGALLRKDSTPPLNQRVFFLLDAGLSRQGLSRDRPQSTTEDSWRGSDCECAMFRLHPSLQFFPVSAVKRSGFLISRTLVTLRCKNTFGFSVVLEWSLVALCEVGDLNRIALKYVFS